MGHPNGVACKPYYESPTKGLKLSRRRELSHSATGLSDLLTSKKHILNRHFPLFTLIVSILVMSISFPLFNVHTKLTQSVNQISYILNLINFLESR